MPQVPGLMKIRMMLLNLLAGLTALCGAQAVHALDYPVKPVRYVVPFPPGGTPDLIARTFAGRLTERWGQQVVVENRLGAAGNIAYGSIASAPGDGYTILQAVPGMLSNASLYRTVPYDVFKDFTPVTMMAVSPHLLAVNSSVPATSLKEFIALAKAKPGELSYGSSGSGTLLHLAGELFKSMSGTNLLHVPYKGSAPAVTDLVAGRISAIFIDILPAQPYLKSGKLRALGLTRATRSPALPDVTPLAELGLPGYDLYAWYGLFVPSATSREIVEKIYQDVAAIVKVPEIRARMLDQGVELVDYPPAQFAEHVKTQFAVLAKVIKESGAREE
jgi:tripartite-type tricarboxylate transporter receptor subunit TctC